MTTKEKYGKSIMEGLIKKEKKKAENIEAQILLEGGRVSGPLITLDTELQVIKDVLFKNGLISKDEFELERWKKVQILLERVLRALKDMKKNKSKIIIPNIMPPKDIRKVRA